MKLATYYYSRHVDLHAADEISHSFSNGVVACCRIELASFVQKFNKFRGEPATQSIQFPNPTVFVHLRYNLHIKNLSVYNKSKQ